MDRIAIIRTEARRLADVLAVTPPDARCPTCPEWSASDLLWHLTNVHFFWAGVLERNPRTESDIAAIEQSKPARPSATPDLLALREQATTALVEQLAQLEDAEPRWTWWPPDQTVGYTRRMQTYEATMHRVDAELTAGLPTGPIAPDVAVGAVDHAVDVMWGWQPEGSTYEARAVVEFVASDPDKRWLVEVGAASDRPERYGRRPGSRRPRLVRPSSTSLCGRGRVPAPCRLGDGRRQLRLNAVISNGMQ
jgi:uncharacterized protein (TIGR03083 family)